MKHLIKIFRRGIVLALLSVLAACGGGSGSEPAKKSLTVDIGNDFSVTQGLESVTVRSIASGGTPPYAYQWSIQPAEQEANANTLTEEDIELTLPTDLTLSETWLLSLQVTDTVGTAVKQQIQLTISVLNTPPVVSFELEDSDGVSASGEAFTLVSDWQDAEDGRAVASAVIKVKQLSGTVLNGLPDDGILFDLTDSAAVPVTSEVSAGQFVNLGSTIASIQLSFEVEDTGGLTTSKTKVLEILPVSQTAPIVNAGNNQVLYEGERIFLSANVDNADNPSYEWRQLAGPKTLEISRSSSTDAYTLAPTTNQIENYSFQFKATNRSSQLSDTDSVTVTVLPIPDFDGINDTGVSECADSRSNRVSCGLTQFPGQDGDFGRDIAATDSDFKKQGEGENAFDLSLIDANGEQLPWTQPTSDAIAAAVCIRDNVTGLIWEIKTTTGLRAHTHTYTWYNDVEMAGGDPGVQNSSSAACDAALASCDTQTYQAAVNQLQLCGGSDWRLPTVRELVSILNYSRTSDKLARAANADIIWPEHAKTNTAYWTSTPALFGVQNEDSPSTNRAWAVNLASGDEASYVKGSPLHLILVR
ncbi:DUF1566 domain-containing protein [Gayadomonas joobiniege]|uniref:Lcl C-terminal domain-containing protein n=1 Tax=Gayadomonas joobiniege TaxID=1234606 RepID=UPI00138AE898|nr:DUF1566 domain-containing protein [Gayadomonas joobiniege]